MTVDPYQFVFPHYAFDGRHYHGIGHVNRMLADAYRYGDKALTLTHNNVVGYTKLKDELYWAILFHDAVYDGLRCDKLSNEAASTMLFRDWAELNHNAIPLSMQQDVSKMIMATEHHFDGTVYDDYLTNLLLDLDLMAFTDDYDSFEKTQVLIDNEFLPYYDAGIVEKKRVKFLTDIYNRQTLQFRVIDPDGVLTTKAYVNLGKYLYK